MGVGLVRSLQPPFFGFTGEYITPLLTLASGYSFYPLLMSIRSFLYLLYTLIKLYYTKALSDQASSQAPDWILLLQRPRIPASFPDLFIVQQQPFSSVAQSCPTLWLHGLQHTRTPCPSPTPRVYSNSCPLIQWCHPTLSSSVVPFSSCLQSCPASGLFKWVSSSHQLPKVLEFQLQHQSFQRIFRTDFL